MSAVRLPGIGFIRRLDGWGHPCPKQLSFPLLLVVTPNLVEGDDEMLGFQAALVPRRPDAGWQNA